MKKGTKHTKEAREKMSKSLKGLPAWNKGLKYSDETKRKIGEASRGRKTFLGKKHTEKTKQKMSEIAKNRKSHPMKGKKHTEEAKEKMRKVKIGKKASAETRKKMSESKKGDKCHTWKGGVTVENDIIRHSMEYRDWRKLVFERDVYTCQDCNDSTGGNLNAHHDKSFSDYKELRFDVSNGITLCADCHMTRHKKSSKCAPY